MFRIRRIYDDVIPANREAIRQVQGIMLQQFPEASEEDLGRLGERLKNPFKQRFRLVLFVADNRRRQVSGFALLMHDPELRASFLDYIATPQVKMGGGVGGALYDRVRAESRALGAKGLFFECHPDELASGATPETLKANRARLRFYERFGARPITGTQYELPLTPDGEVGPHLVYDGLDLGTSLRRVFARKVVRAVLERKYSDLCSPEYVERVVASFRDDPVGLRPLHYLKPEKVQPTITAPAHEPIAFVVTDLHELHQVHEQGYVESPVRIGHIVRALEPSGLFERVQPAAASSRHLYEIHDGALVNYLRDTCKRLDEGEVLYPYVFPIRNQTRPPRDSSVRAGYYCIDTFTPLSRGAWGAARRAMDCAVTGARELLDGRRLAYALVRPPGHHSERSVYGGFCYFNNNAGAAQHLSQHGKVAILDIDYHHGNGQQDIFYGRADVLTVSIHGHPRFAYPYFTGFEEERGDGQGEGFNLNLPLPESRTGAQYRRTLHRALRRIEAFNPAFLVVALGFDTAKGDPTGTWSLTRRDFEQNGRLIGQLGLPSLMVQEGGYRTRTLGTNARSFFEGLVAGQRAAGEHHRPKPSLRGVTFRTEPTAEDAVRVRHLVETTGMFRDHEVPVAEELVRERFEKGEASGYFFHFADWQGRLVGYSCYGPIACTESSYDLYWIAVHPEMQGRGLGRHLIEDTERAIRAAGGSRVYVETSHRLEYASTRGFYQQSGYGLAAVLDDFYAPGDGRATYVKVL